MPQQTIIRNKDARPLTTIDSLEPGEYFEWDGKLWRKLKERDVKARNGTALVNAIDMRDCDTANFGGNQPVHRVISVEVKYEI